ncbi:MAG: hypothetical protein ACI84C_000206 [Flavobacteriales bacterium]|jgi:hypothetical protein
MRKNTLALLLVALTIGFVGCIKDRLVLDDNIALDGLNPSFAAPLLDVSLNMGDLEQNIDDENFIYNEENASFAMIYPKELFTLRANDFLSFPSLSEEFAFTAGGAETVTLNNSPVGATISFSAEDEVSVNTSFGIALDSALVQSGFINIELNSQIPHDTQVLLTIPGLTSNGNEFSEAVDLIYTGSVPFEASGSFDISGYVLDLTDNGATTNYLLVEADIEMTSSGTMTNLGDQVTMEYSFDPLNYAWVFGDFAQQTEVLGVDTQEISLYKDINGGVLHFENPSIELYFNNSTGIPFEFEFLSLIAPENQVASELTGPDLENFPIIEGAAVLGDDVLTTHTINNEGTSPTLSAMLDEEPFKVIYNSSITMNPGGESENFLMDSSRISARANIILPFYGYADNFTLSDTLALDLEKELGVDDPDPDEVLNHEDIERVTLRILVDNGLPVDMGVQLVLLDSLNNTIDSVFTNQDFANIFESGIVDFSLPLSDPDHGKVIQNTVRTTAIVVTQNDLQFWLENNVKKVIVRAFGSSNMGNEDELIKLYPEYNIGVEVSAKVDAQIDTTE